MKPLAPPYKISVIVPTYNSEKTIHAALADLSFQHYPHEILVVDGGSTDRTVSLAAEWTRVITTKRGHAQQLNEGARQATGDVFLFLYADAQLPPRALQKINDALREGAEAGRFTVAFDEGNWFLNVYAAFSKLHFFSFGDEGFFVRREIFEALGGFRENLPFEDIDFYRRLCHHTRPVILQDPIITSVKRFPSMKSLRQYLGHVFLMLIYYAGLDFFRFRRRLKQTGVSS